MDVRHRQPSIMHARLLQVTAFQLHSLRVGIILAVSFVSLVSLRHFSTGGSSWGCLTGRVSFPATVLMIASTIQLHMVVLGGLVIGIIHSVVSSVRGGWQMPADLVLQYFLSVRRRILCHLLGAIPCSYASASS